MFRFRGFTSCANDAVNLALSQACLLGHTYIGSEHLLLGLLLDLLRRPQQGLMSCCKMFKKRILFEK